ncbi:unnamed protein product [Boreogadus saida]
MRNTEGGGGDGGVLQSPGGRLVEREEPTQPYVINPPPPPPHQLSRWRNAKKTKETSPITIGQQEQSINRTQKNQDALNAAAVLSGPSPKTRPHPVNPSLGSTPQCNPNPRSPPTKKNHIHPT